MRTALTPCFFHNQHTPTLPETSHKKINTGKHKNGHYFLVSSTQQSKGSYLITYLRIHPCIYQTTYPPNTKQEVLEKLTGPQLVKKLPHFSEPMSNFIIAFTIARLLSPSRTITISPQFPFLLLSIYFNITHPSTPRSSGLLPSGFPTKTLYPT
jgi:hypothetical protein